MKRAAHSPPRPARSLYHRRQGIESTPGYRRGRRSASLDLELHWPGARGVAFGRSSGIQPFPPRIEVPDDSHVRRKMPARDKASLVCPKFRSLNSAGTFFVRRDRVEMVVRQIAKRT